MSALAPDRLQTARRRQSILFHAAATQPLSSATSYTLLGERGGHSQTQNDCFGSFPDVDAREREIRFAAVNLHRQRGVTCPESAKLGSRHDATFKLNLVERSVSLA